jgi:hypothetical protein
MQFNFLVLVDDEAPKLSFPQAARSLDTAWLSLQLPLVTRMVP